MSELRYMPQHIEDHIIELANWLSTANDVGDIQDRLITFFNLTLKDLHSEVVLKRQLAEANKKSHVWRDKARNWWEAASPYSTPEALKEFLDGVKRMRNAIDKATASDAHPCNHSKPTR
jgi:thiamine kinase-like enzyme